MTLEPSNESSQATSQLTEGEDPGALVRRIEAGDLQAENELVARYHLGVEVILAQLTRDAALAQDIHQETFALVLTKLRAGELRDPKALPGFLRSIARSLLIAQFFGSRQMTQWLRRQGYAVGRKRVRRLFRLLGLRAVCPRPRTSQKNLAHRIYPYLLGNLVITRPNQVWCTNITYIPLQQGFLYLVAVMEWATRKVLPWRLSNTQDAGSWVEALEEAMTFYGTPEIFNTDQGSQFTSLDFTGVLRRAQVKISMDGKGRWIDNVFIERLWCSLKCEEVYLNEYRSGKEAWQGISQWLTFYHQSRPHSALGDLTPDEAYVQVPMQSPLKAA